MIRKIFALLVFSIALSGCESNSTETNSNETQKPSAIAQTSPTPAMVASPSPETSPASAPLKAGDKVKAVNGSFTDATVVSVDEKLGKVTIHIQGQTGEKTVALTEVARQ